MIPSRPSGLDRPRGDWAYVSIVSVIPGVSLDVRVALLVQFLMFEGGAIAFVLWFDRLVALPAATVAIIVTTGGSALMMTLSERVRRLDPPAPYRRLLFESSFDVLLGLVVFIALVTSLVVGGQASGLLYRLIGDDLPPPAVFFALVVIWDICYRIGTGWWASLTGLWRSVKFRDRFDTEVRAAYQRTDVLTMLIAGLQILLVPFLWPDRLLATALLGHIVAVFVVSTVAISLLRWG